MLTTQEQLWEAEAYIESQKKVIDDLISLNLWAARRLLYQQYKDFTYDNLEKITGQKYERV